MLYEMLTGDLPIVSRRDGACSCIKAKLVRGQVGTVVEVLDGAFEIEFSDDRGRAYAQLALSSSRRR